MHPYFKDKFFESIQMIFVWKYNTKDVFISYMLAMAVMTCSRPRRDVRSHSLVCSENSLLIIGIGPVLNKELELIFRSDRSDCTWVYSYLAVLHEKLYIYKRNGKYIVFCILKYNSFFFKSINVPPLRKFQKINEKSHHAKVPEFLYIKTYRKLSCFLRSV